jgi:hypothetical protein
VAPRASHPLPIARMLGLLGARRITLLSEVLEHALGLAPEQQTQSAQKRVAAILTNMGFEKCRPRTPEGRKNRYQRDHPV